MDEKINFRSPTEKLPGYALNAKRAKLRGYSHCFRCGKGWNRVDGHSTNYTAGSGCFPLCEDCWASLTPETRLPYYKELLYWWDDLGCSAEPGTAEAIGVAVMAGG